jgi:hypothetical protein
MTPKKFITRALRASSALARSAPKTKIPRFQILFSHFPEHFPTSRFRAARQHHPGAQRAP